MQFPWRRGLFWRQIVPSKTDVQMIIQINPPANGSDKLIGPLSMESRIAMYSASSDSLCRQLYIFILFIVCSLG